MKRLMTTTHPHPFRPLSAKPRVSKAWPPFETHLAECLGALEEGQYLILSHPKSDYFVQFMGQGRYGLRAEAKSNQFIGQSRSLGPDQERRLIELGWKAPTGEPGSENSDPDGSPNWFREYELPMNWLEAANVGCITLREVYSVRHPAELVYQAFESPAQNIVFPTLGLNRAESADNEGPRPMEWLSELKRAVEAALLPHLEEFGIQRTMSGDLLTVSPRALITVREKETPFQILLFAPLVAGVDAGTTVWQALNALNATLLDGRLYTIDDRIVLDHVIPAEPFVAEHFVRTLRTMHELAQRLSAELQGNLGGTRTQPNREPAGPAE